jgi:hypothetical protein
MLVEADSKEVDGLTKEEEKDTSQNSNWWNQETMASEVAKVKRPMYQSIYFVHNINVFANFKGFEGLLHLV